MQDNLPRMKAVLKKVNIDTGKLSGFARRKMGLSILTGAIALSGLGAGLGAAMSHNAAANAAARPVAMAHYNAANPAARPGTSQSGKYYDKSAPRQMYDSVNIPQIPKGQVVATYINGSYAQPRTVTSGQHPVVWIDTNGSAPAKAQVLDVEPGDATPAAAATWAQTRLAKAPDAHTVIYTMTSQWDAAKAALKAKLSPGQYSKVKWWIADPTGTKHDLKGADAVQWWWGGTGQNPAAIGQTHDINVDVSTVKASFWTK